MNANELADWLDNATNSEDWGELAKYYKWCKENVAPMLRQQQAEIEALKKRVEEVKETNGQFANLIQMYREETDKLRNEILAWENAEVPPETMADIIEELERRGFITK